MKNKPNNNDIIFSIFSSTCILLSVCVFALLRQLTGDPTTKMFASVLIIFLLVVLNVTVLVLYEIIKGIENKRMNINLKGSRVLLFCVI